MNNVHIIWLWRPTSAKLWQSEVAAVSRRRIYQSNNLLRVSDNQERTNKSICIAFDPTVSALQGRTNWIACFCKRLNFCHWSQLTVSYRPTVPQACMSSDVQPVTADNNSTVIIVLKQWNDLGLFSHSSVFCRAILQLCDRAVVARKPDCRGLRLLSWVSWLCMLSVKLLTWP